MKTMKMWVRNGSKELVQVEKTVAYYVKLFAHEKRHVRTSINPFCQDFLNKFFKLKNNIQCANVEPNKNLGNAFLALMRFHLGALSFYGYSRIMTLFNIEGVLDRVYLQFRMFC